jgi:hypothetical protein
MKLFSVGTYPFAAGPGKSSHQDVFHHLMFEIDQLNNPYSGSFQNPQVMYSEFHGSMVHGNAKLVAMYQDQPERRGSNSLQGGNSLQHPLFGVSCRFQDLDKPFKACSTCQEKILEYLDQSDWSHNVIFECDICLGWSIQKLCTVGKYNSPLFNSDFMEEDTPGKWMVDMPGLLTFPLLKEAFEYAVSKFAIQFNWSSKQVTSYLLLLCVSQLTIDKMITQCRNHVVLQEMTNAPHEFDNQAVQYTLLDANCDPGSYLLPVAPPMWSIGSIYQRVETVMHLSMGVQKAVAKLCIQWAKRYGQGIALTKRLSSMLKSIQLLRLSFLPVIPFKDDKFGGYVAETYRGFTMLAPWLYRCLEEDTFETPVPHCPPHDKPQKKWLAKDNKAWLRMRGQDAPDNLPAKEAKALVAAFLEDPDSIPPILPLKPTINIMEIRDLMWRMHTMFASLFAVDLEGSVAGNRSTAYVMHFLSLLDRIDLTMNPEMSKPI